MCGRFVGYRQLDELKEFFPIDRANCDVTANFNVAPTQEILAIYNHEGENWLDKFHWGLVPFWAKDPSIGSRMINARAETVAEKPSFKNALKKRRCLIIADGFYEWQQTGRGPKQPWFIHAEGGGPFLMAALWEHWDKGETPLETCTLLTTEAAGAMNAIHHRMPVILAADYLRPWLDAEGPEDAVAVLERNPATALAMRRISRAVNSPTHEGPDLIEPAGE